MPPSAQPVDRNVLDIVKRHMERGNGADPRTRQAAVDELVRQHVNAEDYTYYDTFWISAFTPRGESAAVNFSGVQTPISFFSTRTMNNNGRATTNMTSKNQQFDYDFLCTAIAIDAFCNGDAPSAIGVATAQAFVECVVQAGALEIAFGDTPKLIRPVVEMPSGGGVVIDSKVRTLALAANSESVNANNGFPAHWAVQGLGEPIAFNQTDTFSTIIHIATDSAGTGGPLGRVNNLQPLTGNFFAGLRIRKMGIRGKALLRGTPRAA